MKLLFAFNVFNVDVQGTRNLKMPCLHLGYVLICQAKKALGLRAQDTLTLACEDHFMVRIEYKVY